MWRAKRLSSKYLPIQEGRHDKSSICDTEIPGVYAKQREAVCALLNDLYPDQRQMVYILTLCYDCGQVDKKVSRIRSLAKNQIVR